MLFFALSGENFNGNKFAKAALEHGAIAAVIDDADYDSKDCILVKDTLECLQKLAVHHRKQLNTPVIALTGSNGKTTTKELISSVLSRKFALSSTRGNLNNHIGVPLSLLKLKKSTELAVIEMGANHQGEIAGLCEIAQPDYGLITNFGKAHLEGFGGIEGVIKGKSELYDYIKKQNGILFVNGDDQRQMQKSEGAKRFVFGESNSFDACINFVEANPFVVVQTQDGEIKSQLIGSYNASNISVAIAIGNYFEVPLEKIKEAIEGYCPKNNRSQIIEKNGQKIILDAYNANPTSVKAALENFDQMKATSKIVILGDMFEIGKNSVLEHQQIVDQLEKMQLDFAFVCGEDFAQTKTQSVQQFKTLKELRKHLQNNTLPKKGLFLVKGSRGMAMEVVLDDVLI